jgi:FkbM family methyltransferase
VTRIIRIVVPTLVLLLLAVLFREWTLPAALYATGRAEGCSFARAARSIREDRRQVAIKDEIVRTSRLVQRDAAGFHLWETSQGSFWIPAASDFALHFDLAEQERKIYGTGAQAVHRGDVVLDCGANIGVFTREALAEGAKLVIAIEPAPENLECLRRNLQHDIEAGRVVIYPKGVWDKEDSLVMRVDPKNSAADSFVINREDMRDSIKLPLTTIDKLVEELKLERVDFVKMDIEGAEPRALAGARQTLARFRPRLALSVYHSPTDKITIPQAVAAGWNGYTQECGPCAERDYRIFPTVYYFR